MANELTTPKVRVTLASYEGQRREMLLRSLAREISMDIFDVEQIMLHHSLDEQDMAEIWQMASFQAMLAEATREWNSVTSTEDRIRYKMLAQLEESLGVIHSRMHAEDTGVAGMAELLKILMRGSGIGEKGTEGSVDRVQISINLGNDMPPVVVDHVPSPEPEAPGERFQLQEAAE